MANNVKYQDLLHDASLRANALSGSTSATLNTTYDVAVLTESNWDSADFPFGSVRDGIIRAEEMFCQAIADNPKHPYRTYIKGTSNPLFNGMPLPTVDNAGKPVIGTIGAILDAASGQPLTPQPIDVITRFIRSGQTVYTTNILYYCIVGTSLFHTANPDVLLDICKYSQADQLTAFAANQPMLLPDTMRAPIADLAVSMFTRDTVFESQAKVYAGYAAKTFADIAAGKTPGESLAL